MCLGFVSFKTVMGWKWGARSYTAIWLRINGKILTEEIRSQWIPNYMQRCLKGVLWLLKAFFSSFFLAVKWYYAKKHHDLSNRDCDEGQDLFRLKCKRQEVHFKTYGMKKTNKQTDKMVYAESQKQAELSSISPKFLSLPSSLLWARSGFP